MTFVFHETVKKENNPLEKSIPFLVVRTFNGT